MSKYFSLIYSGKITRGSQDKVIPASAFSTLCEAADVLKAAQEDVESYLKHNKEECQKLLDQAEQAGFNKGLTEFNKQILYYQEMVKKIEHELQKSVLPLALKAAKRIVGRELELKPETIVDIVRKTLKSVTQNHHIKILVAKQDKEILENEKKNLRKTLEHVQTFVVEEKEDLNPGDCIIVTEAGIINASLENQWRALESAFDAFMKQK